MAEKILLSWSGGKDSALALYEIQKTKDFEIVALVTTITDGYDRVSMHGVRRILIEQQANSLGIRLEDVIISRNASNSEYEARMTDVLTRYLKTGITSVVFGDIFLDDVKRYREEFLEKIGMKGVFPIWKRDSRKLANEFIDLGFKAVITCIDSDVIDKSFVGREFDKRFLIDLPQKSYPCGENGEFHSFVHNGPIFNFPVLFTRGEVILRENRFYYCDLIPI